jgi:hypothetical protein
MTTDDQSEGFGTGEAEEKVVQEPTEKSVRFSGDVVKVIR